MARINIEDQLFIDGRYLHLKALIGEEKALGKLVIAWRLAQTFFSKKELIPHATFEAMDLKTISDVGLARKEESGYYVCGTKDQFAWIEQKSYAGKRSAEVRAEKNNSKKSPGKSNSTKTNTRSTKQGSRSTKSNERSTDVNDRSTKAQQDSTSAQPLSPSLTHSLSQSSVLTNTYPPNPQGLFLNEKKLTPDHVIDLFNKTLAGTGKLKPCPGLGIPSMKAMLESFSRYKTAEDWEKLFLKVKETPRITGETKGVFLATLDWLCIEENALKVESGKYDFVDDENEKSHQVLSYDLTESELERLRAMGEIR